MKKEKNKPVTDVSSVPVMGMPETAFDMVNRYGTYNIQSTAETENAYPAVAQGYNRKIMKTDRQNKKSDSWFMGMGWWTRNNAEVCLVATKGRPKRISRKVHQLIISPVEEHSKKPDITRDKIIELMGDLPRVELFARQAPPGWDVWGNEVLNDVWIE